MRWQPSQKPAVLPTKLHRQSQTVMQMKPGMSLKLRQAMQMRSTGPSRLTLPR